MVDDNTLQAIGHVATQWAYLETQFDWLLHVLSAQPKATKISLPSSRSFRGRTKNLKVAAKAVLAEQPDVLSNLLEIVTDAASLRGHRDDIIHGHWKLHRAKGTLGTGLKTFKDSSSELKVREMAFSAEKAEDIARQISRTNMRLIDWCMKHVRS